MLRSLFWLTLAAALLPSLCRAQAKFTATGPGARVTVGVAASAYQIDYAPRILGGGTVFVDLNPHWRYGLEGEVRFLRYNQSQQINETTYLAGPRISLSPHKLNLYVKLLAGTGRFNFPYGYAYATYFVYAPGAGVDYRLNQKWRWRVADFEYQGWPKFPYGAIHPYGVSTGLSFKVF